MKVILEDTPRCKRRSKAVITVSDLQKSFSGKTVLTIDELTVSEGEMVALLGPSGSGKSTLLRHLSGLVCGDSATTSRIDIAGNTIQQSGKLHKHIRKHRRTIGLIFQQFNLVSRMSTLDNVLVGALGATPWWRTIIRQFSQQQKREAMAALKRVGMDTFAHQPVAQLSGGQQQRVAIARALMQGASVILADEPIASLDPQSSKVVMQLLQNICKETGITVVVTLHQVDYALAFCERVVALQDGSIFYDGASSAVSQSTIQRLYKAEAHEMMNDLGNLLHERPAVDTQTHKIPA